MKNDSKIRVAIYIDGGNFYRRIRQNGLIPKGTQFDYDRFAKFLGKDQKITYRGYYIGIVRNHDKTLKSQKLVQSQQKLLIGLEKEGFCIKKGRVVYDNKIREKGVDVQMAIDLVIGAVENLYDKAVIVSSDTDLIPALRYVKSKGKIVEYVGFSDYPSFGMIKEANLRLLLQRDQIESMKK